MRSENNTESTAFKEEEAKILELSLFKIGSGRQTKVSYQDTLKAFVECQGLEGDTIDLYLCQGDEKTIICQDVLVDRYGIAETSIPLLSSDITTDLIINQEKESGEVYIAAVYNDQEVKSDTFKITSEVVTYESGNSPVKVGVVEVEEKEEVLDPIDENDRFLPKLQIESINKIDKESKKIVYCIINENSTEVLDRKSMSIQFSVTHLGNCKEGFIFPIISTIPDVEKKDNIEKEELVDKIVIDGKPNTEGIIISGEINFRIDIYLKEKNIDKDIYIDFFSSTDSIMKDNYQNLDHRLKIKMVNKNKEDAVVVLTGEISSEQNNGDNCFFMYKVKIYNGICYDDYEDYTNKGALKETDTAELTRDAWKSDKKQKKKRSEERYGSLNEIPPGVYFLSYNSKGYGTKGYKLKISESPQNDVINGVDGIRDGLRIHSYCPKDSFGCLTTGIDEKSSVDDFRKKIPILTKKSVHFIIKERMAEKENGVYVGVKLAE